MAPRCVITDKDTVQLATDGYLLNGKPLASLSGCQFKGDVRIAPAKVVDAAVPLQDTPAPSPPAPPPAPPPQPVLLTGELAEINDWVIIGQQLLNLPPWLAVLLIAAIIFQKTQKNRTATCVGCATLGVRIQQLEATTQALVQPQGESNDLEALKLISAPPPTETQEWSKK